MNYNLKIGKRWAKALAAILVVGGIMTPTASVLAATSQPRDANNNSVIWGGAYSKSEFESKVNGGDGHNSAQNLQQIYFHESRGITMAAFKDSNTVEGEVMKDGRVIVHSQVITVDGQKVTADGVVADNAISGGRNQKSGSTKKGSLWMTKTQVSFLSDSIPAWVHMENGKFGWAIIHSCGNPVEAHAVKVFKAPPAPKQTSLSPSELVSCSVMNKELLSGNRWRFTIVPDGDDSQATGYIFTFNDTFGSVRTGANTPFVDHDVGRNGVQVFGQVQSKAGTSKRISSCAQQVPATATLLKATSTPKSPLSTTGGSAQVLGTQTMPATGPETALGGVAGLAAIAFASRAYLRSRKTLEGSLRNSGRR
jgi:hypothetical protein